MSNDFFGILVEVLVVESWWIPVLCLIIGISWAMKFLKDR